MCRNSYKRYVWDINVNKDVPPVELGLGFYDNTIVNFKKIKMNNKFCDSQMFVNFETHLIHKKFYKENNRLQNYFVWDFFFV